MKNRTALLVLLSTISIGIASGSPKGSAMTLTTLQGKRYERCQVLKVYPDALSIRHANGLARVNFAHLPKDVCQRYNYSPSAAAAYTKSVQTKAVAAKTQRTTRRVEVRQGVSYGDGGGLGYGHASPEIVGNACLPGVDAVSWPLEAHGMNGLLTNRLGDSLGYTGRRNRGAYSSRNAYQTRYGRSPYGHGGYGNYGPSPVRYGAHYFGPVRPQLSFGGYVSPGSYGNHACLPTPAPLVRVHGPVYGGGAIGKH